MAKRITGRVADTTVRDSPTSAANPKVQREAKRARKQEE